MGRQSSSTTHGSRTSWQRRWGITVNPLAEMRTLERGKLGRMVRSHTVPRRHLPDTSLRQKEPAAGRRPIFALLENRNHLSKCILQVLSRFRGWRCVRRLPDVYETPPELRFERWNYSLTKVPPGSIATHRSLHGLPPWDPTAVPRGFCFGENLPR